MKTMRYVTSNVNKKKLNAFLIRKTSTELYRKDPMGEKEITTMNSLYRTNDKRHWVKLQLKRQFFGN